MMPTKTSLFYKSVEIGPNHYRLKYNYVKYKKAALPWLHDWMLAKNASTAELAWRSGVSASTIGAMRSGVPVQLHILSYVVGALEKYDFQYKPKGRKADE